LVNTKSGTYEPTAVMAAVIVLINVCYFFNKVTFDKVLEITKKIEIKFDLNRVICDRI
jgi:hypothetical protein